MIDSAKCESTMGSNDGGGHRFGEGYKTMGLAIVLGKAIKGWGWPSFGEAQLGSDAAEVLYCVVM